MKAPIKLYQKLQEQYSRRINLDLKRIKKVLEKIGNPESNLSNVINIIGSDGKNSVLTSLKYFLEANNESVNTFTSPHLYDVRHRFWLGKRFISLREIKKYKKIVEKTKEKLTLFELLTCIYLLAVKTTDDNSYNLIESGLLFKKDSTNLWSYPLAQIITNINYQHQEWVYPRTISEICRQKTGYLSKDTKIYIGKQKPKIFKKIEKILKKNPSEKKTFKSWKVLYKKNKKYYKDDNNLICLNSKYIASDGLWDNVCLAIKVALDLGVDAKIIAKTIPKIKFEGRIQFIKGKLTKKLKNSKLLLDGCHSFESTRNLSKYLRNFKIPIYGICGFLKNKNPDLLLKNFRGVFKEIVTIKIPNEPSSISSLDLRIIAERNGFKATESKNIKDALKKFPKKGNKIVVVFGSLYLVGHALSLN